MDTAVTQEKNSSDNSAQSSSYINRSEIVKNWLKNPYNLALVCIVLMGFIVRFYFFLQFKGQTLWWDEAEYMGTAKHWATGAPFSVSPLRPPLFMALASLVFDIGLGEEFIKFFLVIIPSTALLVAVFYLGKEMFNEKIGLIAAFFSALSWTLLFWTTRVQPDFFSMFFQVLSFLFIWKYWKEPKTKHIILSGVFAALGFHFKVSGLLVPLIIGCFMILKDRLEAFKIKDYYYFAIAFIATLIPYSIWGYVNYNHIFPLWADYSDQAVDATIQYGWYNIKFFVSLLTPGYLPENLFSNIGKPFNLILFALFLAGVVYALRFLIYVDILIKDKKRCFSAELFCLLSLVIISAFYVFYIKATEDRWVFLWLPFMFFLAGLSLTKLNEKIEKSWKNQSILIIVILMLIAGYSQLTYANGLLEGKRNSYGPVKEASLWIKDNSGINDVISTISITQMSYYTERKLVNYAHIRNISDFEIYLDKEKPKYLVYSVFEPIIFDARMAWMNQYLQTNQSRLVPVQAYFADEAKEQAVLIIYEVKYG